ncbi:hypothetical protein [Natrinema halophilum]|uniref:Uncharacterized protein n=1 Tax=Natrinema halophilum TaxID=1699371 RepID=A0A7D5GUD3_9EURY|nr:hypothetical protein [Natrinema halophilum]QLG50649.1 hypothetical protein HYG82_18320 [Natrinema halophilum]
MNIVRTVLDHLDQAGTDIAIVSIDDIHAEYETVFDFISECQRRTPDTTFDTEFVRPTDRDNNNGEKIILMANPRRITEHDVLDTRIYIVDPRINLKRSLFKYQVNT